MIEHAAVRMAGSEEQVPEGAAANESGARADAARVGFERTAFETIFVTHYARVVGILRRVVGDAGRAEELASEVFLKLYRLGERGSDWGAASPAIRSETAPRVAQFSAQAEGSGQRASGDARGGNLAGWLYRTATNLGIDALRA
ncbi:MAG TPA: sigma factor, partial [Candidatus Acidoferrum sp.]